MDNRYLFKKLESAPSMEAMLAELADEPAVGIAETLPSLSIGSKTSPRDVAVVTFDEACPMVRTGKDKHGKVKEYAWIEVVVEQPHEGYASGQTVPIAPGERASMNLFRHANLKSWVLKLLNADVSEVEGKRVYKFNGSLKGRKFIIGTLGLVTTKSGDAMDYRIKEIDGDE